LPSYIVKVLSKKSLISTTEQHIKQIDKNYIICYICDKLFDLIHHASVDHQVFLEHQSYYADLTGFDENSTGEGAAAIGQRAVTASLQFILRQRQAALKLTTIIRVDQSVDAFTEQVRLCADRHNQYIHDATLLKK